MKAAIDVLVVDEAGQMSLANVAAMGHATDSIVLLGDPQQLDQPLRGSHPPGAERSALAHVLAGAATIAPDRGLFLERTWRLHPALCAFTSEAFYDERLEPEPHLAAQRLRTDVAFVDGVGPRVLPIETVGADNESPVEAAAVADLARSIVGGSWTDANGVSRPIGWRDVLIVAPYNAQVGTIKRLLPPEARVGTVDKFQGQEAPDQHLFAHDLDAGARAARDGLPVQPQSAECRDIQGPLHRGHRGLTGSLARPSADAGTDASGERVLSLHGAGEEDGGAPTASVRPSRS